jgi:hypothetical protein
MPRDDRGGDATSTTDALRAKLEEYERLLASKSRALARLEASRGVPGLASSESESPVASPSNRRRRVSWNEDVDAMTSATNRCACGHVGTSCTEHALSSFWRSFVLAYMVRAGVAVFSRGVGLARSGRPRDALNIELLFGEKHTFYREEAVRLGMFLGSFTGGYHAVRCQLSRRTGMSPKRLALLAGGVGGFGSIFLKKNKRRAYGLYLMARLAQSGYANQKKKGRFHFWGSHWDHGDVLLFALSSAQVMYSYVMRPETLDRGFWNFIVRAGPIGKETLAAVRDNCNGKAVDLTGLLIPGATSAGLGTGTVDFGGKALAAGTLSGGMSSSVFVPCVPCAAMHRSTGCPSCASHVAQSSLATFRKCFPFYLSIHLVPYAILNARKALASPWKTVANAAAATARSTTFISAFVGLYMSTVCASRNAFARDHRALYYVAGVVAASALFVEKKSRRAELALYLMPRAVDAFVNTVNAKRLLPAVPHAELALFVAVSAGLMHLYENEPDTLAGFLRDTIRRFVHRPNAPLPKSASEAVLQACDDDDGAED